MNEPRFPRPPRRNHPVLWTVLLIVAVAGGLLLRHFWVTLATPPPAEVQRPMRTVSLYFAAPDGSGLVAEARQIPDCLVEEDCHRVILQGLIDGPTGALAPVFPPRTTVRGVAVDAGGVLQADFAKELVDNHPGGSWGELLTVYALADTVATNFPHLRQVRILVEGAAVETLKGHVDLRQPIGPDFSMVSEVSAAEPPVAPAGRPR